MKHLRFCCLLSLTVSFPLVTSIWSQSLVHKGDLIYHGAFRLPTDQDGGSRFGYGGTAPVYHPMNNSIFMVGHDWDQKVSEVSIPALVISDDIDDLNTAEMLQPFRDISEGEMYTVDDGTIKIGGLLHDGDKLIMSAYTYYDADGDQLLSHCTSDTNITVVGDVEGMFQLGTLGAGFVSGYMTKVPTEWQSAFGGTAITGQCCIPIISRSSYGPAAFVFDPEDLGVEDPVPVIPLVYYPDEEPLSPWNSTGPWFNGTTSITGVVIPEQRRSVLFFGSHGIGEFCYGTGEDCNDPVNGSQGTHAYPYVFQIWAYDILELLAVKNGQVDPWDVTPYAVWNFDFPITEGNKQIGGATYDPETGMIYVSQLRIDGFDAYPLVHAFTLRGPHLYVDMSASGSGNGTTWANAFTSLQDALAISHAGDTIHVAEGNYYPDIGALQSNADRNEAFVVDSGVVIYGGYPSGGGVRNPVLNPTILSGDIDGNDVVTPATLPAHVVGANAYHVISCEGGVFDGLIISGGLANGTDAMHQVGAGVYASGVMTIRECLITGNIASGTGLNGQGGGLYLANGALTLRNVTFSGNHASDSGSGWYATDGGVVVQQNVELQD